MDIYIYMKSQSRSSNPSRMARLASWSVRWSGDGELKVKHDLMAEMLKTNSSMDWRKSYAVSFWQCQNSDNDRTLTMSELWQCQSERPSSLHGGCSRCSSHGSSTDLSQRGLSGFWNSNYEDGFWALSGSHPPHPLPSGIGGRPPTVDHPRSALDNPARKIWGDPRWLRAKIWNGPPGKAWDSILKGKMKQELFINPARNPSGTIYKSTAEPIRNYL